MTQIRAKPSPLKCHPETLRVTRGELRIFSTMRSRNKFGMTALDGRAHVSTKPVAVQDDVIRVAP